MPMVTKKHIRSTVPKAELRNSESLDYIFNINDPIILDQILALEQTNTQNASLHPPATPFFSLNFDHSMINILHVLKVSLITVSNLIFEAYG
jgi:hypothetical protein